MDSLGGSSSNAAESYDYAAESYDFCDSMLHDIPVFPKRN